MSENFACSNCRMLLQISSEQLGKQVRCPVCGSISVFGSPVEGSPQVENSDNWSPISESRPPKSPPKTQSKRGQESFQSLKSPQSSSDGKWEAVRPTPSIPDFAQDSPRPAADKYVIDETQVAESQTSFDNRWKIGFVFSLLSLLSVVYPMCFCCIVPPIGTVAMGLIGIIATYRSKQGPKTLNYVLAAIGIALSFIAFFLMVLASIFDD